MWLFSENIISKSLSSAVLLLLTVNISAGCGQLELYLYACSFSNHNLSHQSSFKYLSPSIILFLSQRLTNIPAPAFPVGKYDLNTQMSRCLERVCPRGPPPPTARRHQARSVMQSCSATMQIIKRGNQHTPTHAHTHARTNAHTVGDTFG